MVLSEDSQPVWSGSQTAYGAPLADPRQAVAVLRAVASRHGFELSDTTDFDSAVAVVAVDVWMSALNVGDLSSARKAGLGPLDALSAALAVAAGGGLEGRTTTFDSLVSRMWNDPVDPARIEMLAAWAHDHDLDAALVLTTAASLLRRATNHRLQKAADLLDACA